MRRIIRAVIAADKNADHALTIDQVEFLEAVLAFPEEGSVAVMAVQDLLNAERPFTKEVATALARIFRIIITFAPELTAELTRLRFRNAAIDE